MRTIHAALMALILALAIAPGCARTVAVDQIPIGTEVTVKQHGGETIVGRLVQVTPSHIVVEDRANRQAKTIDRQRVSSVAAMAIPLTPGATGQTSGAASGTAGTAATASDGSRAAEGLPASAAPAVREITIPAGTVLPLRLETALGSDISNIEDPVRAVVRRAVQVSGETAIPAGSTVLGSVTAAERSGKVKGRARLAFRFHTMVLPGGSEQYTIRTGSLARVAPGTKKKDAAKIGIPAAGGAAVGAIVGGKKGALIGGAVGGGAGTAVVLTTRGKEVRLGRGALVAARLIESLTIEVPATR